jgi:lactoylglutathione lyase
MLKIEHIAMWVKDLEKQKGFYSKYFSALSGPKYINPTKKFESYFLSFEEGCRLEIMQRPDILKKYEDNTSQYFGLAHFAISLGSKENVDALTQRFRNDGFLILDGPRTTGDGYYESVILDPEGNRIEITI